MKLELIVEAEPSRKPEKIASFARKALKLPCAVKVTVPDAPLGTPKALALAIASYLERLGVPAIAHVRLRDMNRLLFEQVVWSTLYLGVRRLLFLRGDPPRKGVDVDEVSSIEAARYVKADERLRYLDVGLYMSLRYPRESVLERAFMAPVDFYVFNHFDPTRQDHIEVIKVVKERVNARVYAYMILAPGREVEKLRERLGGRQAVYPLEELDTHLERYAYSGLDGAVITAPGYSNILLEHLEHVCRR